MQGSNDAHLAGFLGLAVEQQAVGAVGRDDGARQEHERGDDGKAQAEAPAPVIVLHACVLQPATQV